MILVNAKIINPKTPRILDEVPPVGGSDWPDLDYLFIDIDLLEIIREYIPAVRKLLIVLTSLATHLYFSRHINLI